jgi:rubredoxin
MGRIQFHHVISGSDTKGWVHTHGMDRFGLPELEMRNVPGFLAEVAANILREACDYMIDSGRQVSLGETMAVSERTVFRFVKAKPIPGQDNHYKTERWQIMEVECQCQECGATKTQTGDLQ